MSESPSKQSNTPAAAESQKPAAPPSLSPYICVNDGVAAIDFYERAFGAVLCERHNTPDGKRVMYAKLDLNGGALMLSDDFPEHAGGKSRTPQAFGGTPVVLHLELADVDATWKQAVAAGATILMPLSDQFWGDRYGQLSDPFGYTWALSSPVKQAQSAA